MYVGPLRRSRTMRGVRIATDQVLLQVPGDMPAVLDREQALVVKLPCPRNDPLEAGGGGHAP